jgi:bifunctional non-homologous end joining protein LigD
VAARGSAGGRSDDAGVAAGAGHAIRRHHALVERDVDAHDLVRPMLAVPGELPADETGWAFEMKWDGVRAVAYVGADGVRLFSRNDLDVSRSYPEVLAPPGALAGRGAVLDGELVTFDAAGRPSFGRLQERMHVADVALAWRLAERVPVVYLVFDLLRLDGESLLRRPYAERRAALEGLDLDPGPGRAGWRVPPRFPGPGSDVLAASREHGLEGVVVKRLASAYLPGRRSPDWRKVKHVRMQEVVVAGWRPGQGRRAGGIGSLVLGVTGAAGLEFAGGVGTGFTERMLDDLAARLAPLARPAHPFAVQPPRDQIRDARWVEPRLVGEVAYAEWTSDGRLRHPSWRGLRPDKRPGEVRKEPS